MVPPDPKKRAGMRAVFRIFPKQACMYTVKNVLWWLEKLGVDNDTVMVPALCGVETDFTDHTIYLSNLKRVWELKNTLIMGCYAQDVTACWIGGPPSDIRRHSGSFLQFLMDRIMADIVSKGGVSNFIRINREFKKLYDKPTKNRKTWLEKTKNKEPLLITYDPTSAASCDLGGCYKQEGNSLVRIGFQNEGCAEWSGSTYGN